MGWFDGASVVGGSSHHHHRSSSSTHQQHRSSSGRHSPSQHHSSAGSIFGTGERHHNASRSSLFGFGSKSSTSHYKRSPRSGYVSRIYKQLRRLWHDLLYYLKRHPMKVFVLVIMPLITGGALSGLLARFGIRLPRGLDRMFPGSRGTSISRSPGGGLQFERSKVEGPLGALGGLAGGAGGLMSLAKMFM